jgi:hypothetical protein
MVKVLNVTIDDHLMDDIIEEARPEGMNKSEWVRRLLSYGWQVERAKREQTITTEMRMAGFEPATTRINQTPFINPTGFVAQIIGGMRS